jgi:hypothetical protein
MSWYPGGTNASHITRNPVVGRCFAAGHPARSGARRRHREVQGWHVLDREGRERTVFLPRRSGESRCGETVDSGVPEREHAVLSRDGSTRRHRALQGWHVLDEQRAPGGVCASRRRHPVAASGGNSGTTGASGLKCLTDCGYQPDRRRPDPSKAPRMPRVSCVATLRATGDFRILSNAPGAGFAPPRDGAGAGAPGVDEPGAAAGGGGATRAASISRALSRSMS